MLDWVALARTVHGHVGLLAAVALLHPAWVLRGEKPLRRGTRWSMGLATGLVTATVVGGWLLYPGYRAVDKPRLLHEAFPVAMAFEVKEHLGFYVLVLAWSGTLLATVAGDRRLARTLFALAAALAFGVGALGTVVSAS